MQSDIADIDAVKPLTRPLFQFDPGWLFVAAGIAVCAAGVILPAQSDLRALQFQLQQLQGEESRAYARLKAHTDFMDQIDRADPALIRRLAATQLNLVPEGDTPVLLASSAMVPVTHWIDSSVQVDIRPPNPAPTSTLSRLANGPYRLWMFGGGIMCVFVGLMLGPGVTRQERINMEESQDEASGAALLEPEGDQDAPARVQADDPEILVELDDHGEAAEINVAPPALNEMDADVALEQLVECEAETCPPESEIAIVEPLVASGSADSACEIDEASPQDQLATTPDVEAAAEIEITDQCADHARNDDDDDVDDDVDESNQSDSPQVLVIEDHGSEIDDADDDVNEADASDRPSTRYHNRLREQE